MASLTGPDADGNYSYTPDQDFEGVANFNYLIKDKPRWFNFQFSQPYSDSC